MEHELPSKICDIAGTQQFLKSNLSFSKPSIIFTGPLGKQAFIDTI